MATFLPFISSGHTIGDDQEIWAQVGLPFFRVGTGKLSILLPFEIAAEGSANVAGETHSGSLRLKLTDQDPSAATGPCHFEATGLAGSGSGQYRVDDDKLVLSLDGGFTAVIKRCERGKETAIEIAGTPALHIKPI